MLCTPLTLLLRLLHGTSFSHLMTFLPPLVRPSSAPLHWVESWSTSDFLNSVPYVKNKLTDYQISWK